MEINLHLYNIIIIYLTRIIKRGPFPWSSLNFCPSALHVVECRQLFSPVFLSIRIPKTNGHLPPGSRGLTAPPLPYLSRTNRSSRCPPLQTLHQPPPPSSPDTSFIVLPHGYRRHHRTPRWRKRRAGEFGSRGGGTEGGGVDLGGGEQGSGDEPPRLAPVLAVWHEGNIDTVVKEHVGEHVRRVGDEEVVDNKCRTPGTRHSAAEQHCS